MTLKISALPYLNTRPLTDGLDELTGIRLTTAYPSSQIDLLQAGQADAALVPAVDFIRSRDKLAPAAPYGITACGPVWTVRIISNEPLSGIKTLGLDSESHSSVMLARILLNKYTKSEVEFTETTINQNQDRGNTNRLVIGDKALEAGGGRYVYDLGQLWQESFGLPFVFALWARRRETTADAEKLERILSETVRRNLTRPDQLADRYAGQHGFTQAQALQYLTNIIHYHLGDRQWQGLRCFERLINEYEGKSRT